MNCWPSTVCMFTKSSPQQQWSGVKKCQGSNHLLCTLDMIDEFTKAPISVTRQRRKKPPSQQLSYRMLEMLRMTQMLCHREAFALYIRAQCSLLSHLAPNSFVENLMLYQNNVSVMISRCVPAKDFSRQFQVSAILRSLNQFKWKPSSEEVYLLHYVIYNKPHPLKLELDYITTFEPR